MGMFDGQVALVVGGSSGIGEAAAVAFAREGARVVVAARREPEGQQTVDQVREAGSDGLFVQTDVTDAAQVAQLVDRTVAAFGGLHFAFNEAGSGTNQPVAEMSYQSWHDDLAVNLHAVFYGLRYQIPAIIASGGGAIVNMSSQTSIVAAPGYGAYGAAKTGVRINAISPGTILTPITATVPPAMDDAIMRAVPMGRRGTSAEVASAVIYLCSPGAGFITGTNLSVDGGFTAGQLLR